MKCESCSLVVIQGVPCHEKGCPDSWIDPETELGYELECTFCGSRFIPEHSMQKLCMDCLDPDYDEDN